MGEVATAGRGGDNTANSGEGKNQSFKHLDEGRLSWPILSLKSRKDLQCRIWDVVEYICQVVARSSMLIYMFSST